MMGNLRKWGIRWILSAACIGVTATAHATCTGPQTMTAKLHAQPTTENAIQLGSWFAGRKQFQCAAEIFRAALKADPQSAQLNYLEALALVGLGNQAAAIPALEESIRLDSTVLKPHLLLADLYEKSGKDSEAEQQWNRALAIDPHSDIALDGLSALLLARKDYVGVIGLLKNAPRTEALALRLAKGLDALNYFELASEVLLEGSKLSPDSLPLAGAEAVVLVKKRNFREAVKLAKYTLDHHPGDRQAELSYLRILVMTQHYPEARPLGLKLLAESPHDAEVLYLNGVEDREVGDYASSKAHLEEAVTLVPDFSYSRLHLGMTLVALHEWQEAKENLEKAIAWGNPEPKAHYELALALHGLGDKERSAQEIEKYRNTRQADEANLEAERFSVHGDIDLAAGDVNGAISDYRTATEKSPQNAGYRYQLALALHKAGDTDGALAALEEAVKLNPELAGAQRELGYLLSRSGDSVRSIEHFRMAVKAAPSWTEAWINLAAELGETGQFAEARIAVATALRLDPANAEARELSDQLAHDPAALQSNP